MGVLLLLLLAAPSPSPRPSSSASPSPAPQADLPVILFLVDNSASLPPLDPEEKRVAALEKLFGFLKGRRYRLILFGGRREIFVDEVSRYNSRGQWTDFYFAFDKAREMMATYPPKTEFRIVLLTDALLDPNPADWEDMNVPKGQDLKTYWIKRLLDLIHEIKVPLYVILVGDPPKEGVATGSREEAPVLALDMVRAANGSAASPMAQSIAAFFKDDGLLVKKFVFRVKPQEGLKQIVPVVQRIVAPPRPQVELQFFTFLVLPLFLVLFTLLGLLVRSFPGPADLEILEITRNSPIHLAVDRRHRLETGEWVTWGLSLVADAREAAATVTYQPPPIDLSGVGLAAEGLDPLSQKLLPLRPESLQKALDDFADKGTKEEKIYALNLDYMAKNLDPAEAERILSSSGGDRRRIPALDFLRAKAHLLSNSELRRKLTDSRASIVGYGIGADRKDLAPGTRVRIGRYGFIVKDLTPGGRKDVRLSLYYDRVPSLLGLKTLLPTAFQRVFRIRRAGQRIVS